MNRFWGHTLSSALVAMAAASAFPACAHNDGSLFVHGVLYPPVPNGNQGCVYTADPTAAELPRGRVDAALTSAYAPEFLLGSSLIAQANAVTPQSETSTLTIQGVDVRVVDPVTNAQVIDVDVLTAGIVEAASGATPSYSAIAAEVMDETALSHFDPGVDSVTGEPNPPKLAEVYVQFYGTTFGGEHIQSDEFLFPVDVCHGCLVSFPSTADVAAYCKGAGSSLATSEPCVIGQDQSLDCQQCYALYTPPLAACLPP
jgi:hypothetical protein